MWGTKFIKGGAWNVRRLGGESTFIDPKMCVLAMCESMGWDFAVLSDLKFKTNDAREHQSPKQKWSLIISGKVGVMMNEPMTRA